MPNYDVLLYDGVFNSSRVSVSGGDDPKSWGKKIGAPFTCDSDVPMHSANVDYQVEVCGVFIWASDIDSSLIGEEE